MCDQLINDHLVIYRDVFDNITNDNVIHHFQNINVVEDNCKMRNFYLFVDIETILHLFSSQYFIMSFILYWSHKAKFLDPPLIDGYRYIYRYYLDAQISIDI